jgi:hypothetical protein
MRKIYKVVVTLQFVFVTSMLVLILFNILLKK